MNIVTNVSVIMILMIAVAMDVREYKVPNWLVIAGWFMSFVLSIHFNGLIGILQWSANCIIPVLVLLPLFVLKGIGGADIKMFSVISCFWGMKNVHSVILISFILGAIFALLKMIYKKNLIIRLQLLANYFKDVIMCRKVSRYHITYNENDGLIHFMIPIFLASIIKMYI